MKQKVLKLANITGIVILAITIIIFNLIIGGNEKALPILPIAILMGISLAILFIKKIVYKEKIIKSKIDIAVTIFMITLLLPLIFKTYCTYSGTIEFILKYFFVYTMYLLTRNVIDTKKKMSILIYGTIFSSLIFIILGLDIEHKKYFNNLIDYLDLKYTPSDRFSSTFGYANAVSIYITFLIFLAINRIENTDKKLPKIFLVIYIILGTYIIWISYSRVVLILYVLSLAIYMFLKTYKKLKIDKHKLKCIGVVIIGIIAFIIMYLNMVMKYSTPYEYSLEDFKFRRDFEANKEYNITLYIDVTNVENYKKNAQIQIIEVNKYFKENVIASEQFNPIDYICRLKFTPSEDTLYIKMKIKNKGKCKFFIDKCYINDEEYVFKHKYVPRIITRLIKSFRMDDDSIVLRKQFYENSIRIWKDSPIIGHGGNAWKRLSLAYEDYYYAVKETHSYFFELLISYGIIGVAAFLGIITLLCKISIKEMRQNKESRKEKLPIFIGLILLIGYSLTFDFSMSFIVIILAIFMFIALMQFKNTEEINIKVIDYFVLIALFVILMVLVKANIAKYLAKENSEKLSLASYVADYNYNNVQKDNIESIKNYMVKEPYLAQNYMYKLYWTYIKENYSNISKEELIKQIEFIVDRFSKVKPVAQMDFNKMFERVNIMNESIEILNDIQNTQEIDLKKQINELSKIMKEEYKINIVNLKDLQRNKLNIVTSEKYIKRYEEILNRLDI